MRRGMTWLDVCVTLATIAVIFACTMAGNVRREARLADSISNLKTIASATAKYQQDHRGYLPIVLTYTRGSMQSPTSGSLVGYTTWSAGGKNCNAFWATASGGGFDVEAADRPLNPYLYLPSRFTAPAPPARLSAGDPRRTNDQLPVFFDPADTRRTYERNWPNATTTTGSYDDVGTSYQWNAAWFGQIQSPTQFVARFNEGTRRLSVMQGVDPDRFVWMHTKEVTIITNNPSRTFVLNDDYNTLNGAQFVFYDGHVAYGEALPGGMGKAFSNETYSLRFE